MVAVIKRTMSIADHPVRRKVYVIPTPSIDEFYTRVRRCFEFGTPGGGLYGHQRFGKTRAIRFSRKMLSVEFPKLVTHEFLCLKSKSRSESAFFSYLLRAVGHKHPHAGSIDRKRARLIEKLVEQVERSGEHTVMFFVDEAQRLDVFEYEWLRDVYDQLEKHGIVVIVFMVGQPDLLNQKDSLRRTQHMQIVGRFLTHLTPFRGLLSVDDVATCLASYDVSCYPERSDWTYTRFFFPRAYAEGFRLEHCAPIVWNAFADAHDAARFTFDMELPMKYFTQAIEIALLSNAEHDSEDFHVTSALWDQAVMESRYVAAQESVHLILPDASG